MMVMIATSTNGMIHYFAGRYPGKIGWMMSPPTKFLEPRHWLPYAIDNGKFSSWNSGQTWDEEKFYALLDRCRLSRYKPRWVAVPDEVANKEQTLSLWNQHEHRIRQYGWPVAFVVQDGMVPGDVPESAEVVFVGGSTEWKWRNAALFCAAFPRVHIGRVHAIVKIEYCERLGVESCDGSGFFRGGEGNIKVMRLEEFLGGHRRYEEQVHMEAMG